MSGKRPSVGGKFYRVFQDAQRHTCIRVACSQEGVWLIPMHTIIEVVFLSHKEFEMRYVRELTDYPLKKAAASYLGATWLTFSHEAKKHLEYLRNGYVIDTAVDYNFLNKEFIMSEEAKAAAEKKAAGKKTEVKKATAPAPKKAAGKVEKPAPAPKAAPKKVAAPKADGEKAKRISKEAGMKIKVLDKNPAVRPGSSREAQYKVLLSCKTTDEAGDKLRELTDKPWDLVRHAVTAGVIELVK